MTKEKEGKEKLEEKPAEAPKEKETKTEELTPDEKRKRRNKCCCALLGVTGFIILVLIIVRFAFGGFSSGEHPIPIAINKTASSQPNSSTIQPSNPGDTGQKSSGSGQSSENPPQQFETEAADVRGNDQLLNFFVEIAAKDTSGNAMAICRWTKNPTTVGVAEGNLDGLTSQELDNFTSDFNSQSGTIRLQRTGGRGDINIYYLSPEEILRLSGGRTDGGFHENLTGEGCVMTEGRVYISNDPANSADFKKYLIRHEMTHTMGFWGHSDIYSESIMTVAREGYNFPECDRKAIQLLYSHNLPLCSREDQIRAIYK